MHEVLVNRLGGLSLPRKSVVRLTDRPDMTLDVYRGRKTTMQQLVHSVGSHMTQILKHMIASELSTTLFVGRPIIELLTKLGTALLIRK